MKNIASLVVLVGTLAFSFKGQQVFSQIVDSTITPKKCTNSIITTDIYRKGFYANIDEYISNNPSIQAKSVKVKKRDAVLEGGGWYTLDLPDTNIKVKSFLKKVWGYCNGNEIYVNDGVMLENNAVTFSKVAMVGTLSLVECHDLRSKAEKTLSIGMYNNMMMGIEVYMMGETPLQEAFMINLEDKSIKHFNEFTFSEVLYHRDRPMYDDLRAKPDSERVAWLITYVIKYNEKKLRY